MYHPTTFFIPLPTIFNKKILRNDKNRKKTIYNDKQMETQNPYA